MAIIRKNELKQMNESQINERLTALKKEMMRYNAQIAVGTTPENPGRVRELKKTIARLLTILHQNKKSAQLAQTKNAQLAKIKKDEIKTKPKEVKKKKA